MFPLYFLNIFSLSELSNSSILSSIPNSISNSLHDSIKAFNCLYLGDEAFCDLDFIFFRISMSLLNSSFIAYIVFLISFSCLLEFHLSSFWCSFVSIIFEFIWIHSSAYTHSLQFQWSFLLVFFEFVVWNFICSLSFISFIVELLLFGGDMLPYFFTLLVFLCWHLNIWG
jgi:hypothetical protein